MQTFTANETDYEKLSYGKLGYKRVQRLRRKGQRRGIDVPKLGFGLTKPEKPRIAFWIAAIVGIVLFVAILVATGFLIKFLIEVFSDFYKDTGGFFKTVANPKMLFATQGLSAVPLLILIMAYLFLALIIIVPIIIAVYCYSFAVNTFYLAQCSKEEFAKGEKVSGSILSYTLILVAATVILIVILLATDAQTAKLLVGLIYAVTVIIFGGLLTLIVLEKVKCAKWFAGLDEYKRQNFIAHDRALRRVKSRLHFERKLWNDMFK